jgi:hypothetical protein
MLLRTLLLAALALMPVSQAAAAPRTILFVGNSFTFGARTAVEHYRPDLVTDLNRQGIGGVPALFETFAREAGLDWAVSLETSPGKTLQWHLDTHRAAIGGRWDVVILQGYSTLDPDRPGDPAAHIAAAKALAALIRRANPAAEVDLVSTWTRPDQTYRPGGHWYGKPVEAMADDLAAANDRALAESHDLAAAVPVGRAFSRAIREGVADPNPYDGLAPGTVDLWADDHYHASAAGYYLEALVIFGRITGTDPRRLGEREEAAAALGLPPALASALQRVAAEQLAADRPVTPAAGPR